MINALRLANRDLDETLIYFYQHLVDLHQLVSENAQWFLNGICMLKMNVQCPGDEIPGTHVS